MSGRHFELDFGKDEDCLKSSGSIWQRIDGVDGPQIMERLALSELTMNGRVDCERLEISATERGEGIET